MISRKTGERGTTRIFRKTHRVRLTTRMSRKNESTGVRGTTRISRKKSTWNN